MLRTPGWLAAALLVLVACTPPSGAPGSPASPSPGALTPTPPEPVAGGGTLRLGMANDPLSLDPRFVADAEGAVVVDALFDALVALDAQHRVVPAAAESWEVIDHGREFVFSLRPARFHDGTAVTAHDFVRSFQRLADGTAEPPSFLGYLLDPVVGAQAAAGGAPLEGVEAVDDQTLRIRLDQPQPGYLRTLADPSLVPVPAIADDDPEGFAERPVGNGPFQMVGEREPGQFIRLARFADHWQPAILDEVVVQIYSDDAAGDRQWEDFRDGQLQVAELPVDRLPDAIREYGLSVDGYRGSGVLNGITSTVYLYAFNLAQPPFDDVRVRRALSLAIDRESMADDVLAGTRVAADAIVPPPVPGSQRNACGDCRHDPEAAAALWAEVVADHEEREEAPPGPIVLSYNRGSIHATIAEQMAADIESALDVEVEVDARDLPAFVQAMRAGELGLFRLGWEATEPDPGAYLHPLFHSTMRGRDNVSGYASDEVDALLDQARATDAPAVSRGAYQAAERLILDDLPVLPLLYHRHARVVAPEVRGLHWNAFGRVDLARVSLAPAG